MHLFAIINGIKNQYYIALVTTASRENCMELLQFYNVQDCFDLIITQEDVEEVKPAPEGFIKAMSFFNVIPQNTIVFEDSEAGIEAALRSKACVVKIEK